MTENTTTRCTYTTHYGLKHGENLTDNEIANGIMLGVIEPVMKHGFALYNYDPDAIEQLYTHIE
jgi:hypothetical protein